MDEAAPPARLDLTLLGAAVSVSCEPEEAPRLADLAAAIEARFAGGAGTPAERLARAALALMAENQAVAAALFRARGEIDKLNELAGVAAAATQSTPPKSI